MSSNLVLHCGARPVIEEELRAVKAPPPEGRWYPLAHAKVLDTVRSTLTDAGYTILKQQFGLSRGDHRFFGTLDLATPLVSGVALAVGVRNSTDKSFPLGFCAGNRVFCCDNLAFRAELLVKKKHTRFGEQRFASSIATAVASLRSFKEVEEERIRRFMNTEVSADLADAFILRAFEKGIISTPQLPDVIKEWREPSFEEFRPRTVWSLMNAFTTVLRPRAQKMPHLLAGQTMRLNSLLDFHRDAEPEIANAV